MKLTIKDYRGVEVPLEVIKDHYASNGNVALQLKVAETIEAKNPDDSYYKGESWGFITANIGGLRKDEFALDNDMATYGSVEALTAILNAVAVNLIPRRFVQSGFATFTIYRLKPEFCD